MARLNNIPDHDRLIVALDLPDYDSALQFVDELGSQVYFYKVGLQLLSSGTGIQLIELLIGRGYKVFADFKLYDIPATVSRAVKNLNQLGVHFLTVHGDPQIMSAAVKAADNLSILAVTVLTSLGDKDLRSMGYSDTVEETVLKRASQAHHSGCAGVIASGREVHLIRSNFDQLQIVTPGIRSGDQAQNDQVRTVSATQAIQSGADYLVVGRPIRDAANPAEAASLIQIEIQKALAGN